MMKHNKKLKCFKELIRHMHENMYMPKILKNAIL